MGRGEEVGRDVTGRLIDAKATSLETESKKKKGGGENEVIQSPSGNFITGIRIDNRGYDYDNDSDRNSNVSISTHANHLGFHKNQFGPPSKIDLVDTNEYLPPLFTYHYAP